MARQEVEKLYSVFSRYPHPSRLEGCPCCTSEAAALPLICKRLRDLEVSDLDHYAMKAISTWGTLEDYKFFIPRILELSVQQEGPWCGIEMTLAKFVYGDFWRWPDEEQVAVRDFVFGVWKDCVRSTDVDRAEAFLCGAAVIFEDISPLLAYVDSVEPNFKRAFARGHADPQTREMLNSFWDRGSRNYEGVVGWIFSSGES